MVIGMADPGVTLYPVYQALDEPSGGFLLRESIGVFVDAVMFVVKCERNLCGEMSDLCSVFL